MSSDPSTEIKATGSELLDWLRERGVVEVDGKATKAVLRAHGKAALTGAAQRLRSREWAAASGAESCAEHPAEFTGDCPICRGIWTS